MKHSTIDPSAPDSPHIKGSQPLHSDLPFACEILALRAERPQEPWKEIRLELVEAASKNKVSEVSSILRKLGCLGGPDDNLTGTGATIAGVFRRPESDNNTVPPIDTKNSLTPTEQALFQLLLLEYDPIPMLAVLHQVETESVSCGNSVDRASGFIKRVEHLKNYEPTWTENTKQTKSEVHFDWAEHLDWIVPAGNSDRYELTNKGRQLRKRLSHLQPEDWVVSSQQNSLPGTE
ncbi:hypothetical protein [Halorubrum sp. Eb13]|uniref:hypothetical protein n=1 Tax=Halorubrum sp. Eb13 TaxID=1383843 RepID=UPI00113FEDEE|nr:hypothetical protein [Halorubrum sp. Eb13]